MTDAQYQALHNLVLGIQAKVERIEAAVAGGGVPPVAPGVQAQRGQVVEQEIASDADLDGPHGDFEVRKDPKNWKGPSYVGCRLSSCPSDYLELLAEVFDWRAEQDERKGDPNAKYRRKDAGRCRGWARRLSAKQAPRTGAGKHHSGTPQAFAERKPVPRVPHGENPDAEPPEL